MTKTNHVEIIKVKDSDIPPYLKDCMKKYSRDLQLLTTDTVDLWATTNQKHITKNRVASALVSPLVQHFLVMLVAAIGSNEKETRETAHSLIDDQLNHLLSIFIKD